MKHRSGCIVFTIVGLAWLGFFLFEWTVLAMASCAGDEACERYDGYVHGLIFWRGLAVALLLILAYLGFRSLYKDEDVQ